MWQSWKCIHPRTVFTQSARTIIFSDKKIGSSNELISHTNYFERAIVIIQTSECPRASNTWSHNSSSTASCTKQHSQQPLTQSQTPFLWCLYHQSCAHFAHNWQTSQLSICRDWRQHYCDMFLSVKSHYQLQQQVLASRIQILPQFMCINWKRNCRRCSMGRVLKEGLLQWCWLRVWLKLEDGKYWRLRNLGSGDFYHYLV